ncbi:MAG: tRNA-specific adenosine deaminase [Desulfobacula sp. RIFOXYB2_FULL_45_6]|nr:MAG: tRNA-specific adenosine deaminase [Desulfobacula sp. RIFOXYB2_FULL_45_6]
MMDDEYYMNLALIEARKAAESDEVPVGAIIIDNGNHVIGYGHNCPITSHDPSSHAEINAIRMASKAMNNYRLVDTTLYVTLEPCIMCMGAIIHARIKRVVFSAKDPKWGAAVSLYQLADDKRLNHHPEINSGIFEEQTKHLIRNFFINKRSL